MPTFVQGDMQRIAAAAAVPKLDLVNEQVKHVGRGHFDNDAREYTHVREFKNEQCRFGSSDNANPDASAFNTKAEWRARNCVYQHKACKTPKELMLTWTARALPRWHQADQLRCLRM